MAKNNHIPENDPDLILAKEYRKKMGEGRTEKKIDDPLYNILSAARKQSDNFEAALPVQGKEEIWADLKKSISGAHKKRAKIFNLSGNQKWYWAAAAVALVMFASIYFLQKTFVAEPVLLADSGQTISAIQLSDGSTITLRPNSLLYEVTISDSEHSYSLSGEALFEVVNNPERTFTVEAGNGRVQVLGTRFNLHDRNQRTAVYLLNGSISFETADASHSIILEPGQASVIDENNQLIEPFLFNEEDITGWIQNRLVFGNREVQSILAELEFHFNITIDAPETIKREVLGGSIPLNEPGQSLNDLGIVLDGEFIQTGESSYQFRKNP